MIVVYPFSTIDQDLALKNAKWMKELGGCRNHEVFMLYDKRCVPELVTEIQAALNDSFDIVHYLQAGAIIDGWPQGANYFFRVATGWLQDKDWKYFLWLEPDAIPMRKGWLDEILQEYLKCKRLFMGDRVQVENIPLHMSGVGIYPNPLHQYAGEAYRAHDEAWDMAARNQIVPQAYFTNLIEHAWKHPKFTSIVELQTQIRPECILFHSSKDGSLIKLLRQKLFPAAPVPAEPQNEASPKGPNSAGGEARESTTTDPLDVGRRDSRGGREPISCDIFIRTYENDYEWLYWCIRTIDKFATGFRKIWIVSPEQPPEWMLPRMNKNLHSGTPIQWKVMKDDTEDGYLAQQITKLYADLMAKNEPDYILHVDSDVMFTRPITPADFFYKDKIIWLHTPWWSIQTPWKPIVERFMQCQVDFEFMRRFPLMMPKWIYPKLREFCHSIHGVPVSQYIVNQPKGAFSEYNALGAYAWKFHHDQFHWVNTVLVDIPISCARQYRSYDGITPEIKSEIEGFLRSGYLGSPATVPATRQGEASEVNAAPQIKKLPSGVWVLEGDQISQWVEQEGRLDHDQNFLPKVLSHIKNGDTVVDIGAFVGDHTIAYARAVGTSGKVMAFEPNAIASKCLDHNVDLLGFDNVMTYEVALGDIPGTVTLSGNNGNWGGVYVGEHMPIGLVEVLPLDGYCLKPDLIKIDVEGYEMKVLAGAEVTIETHKPKLIIEVNHEALRRQGSYPGEIFKWVSDRGYRWSIMQENCGRTDPMYDILCEPVEESQGVSPLPAGENPPPQVAVHVHALVEYAQKSKNNRKYVKQLLTKHGLRPRKEIK